MWFLAARHDDRRFAKGPGSDPGPTCPSSPTVRPAGRRRYQQVETVRGETRCFRITAAGSKTIEGSQRQHRNHWDRILVTLKSPLLTLHLLNCGQIAAASKAA